MSISKAFGRYFSLFLGAVLFAFAVVGALSAQTVLAQPVHAGKEPPAGPIVYDLTPSGARSSHGTRLAEPRQRSRPDAKPACRGQGSSSTGEDGQAL